MSHWWENYPWRMVQTNLRQIDMEHMDAAAYAQSLSDFGATVVTLNAAGILASYETEHPCHYRSEHLTGDSLLEMIHECHKRGIRVIARTDFSKVHESLAQAHPDWLYRDTEGKVSNYNGFVQVCMNGEYQQKIMFEILREVLSTHPFDGLFCNMSGFLMMDYSGKIYPPCQCGNCRRLFREQYGLDLPKSHNFADPVYLKYNEFKGRCTAQHKHKLHALVQGISPELAMNGFEYQRSESNTDIGRPAWPYSASSNSRIIKGVDSACPVDNASTDFIGFRYRDISVSPWLMKLRQWQNLANGGAVSLFVMGTLDNHRDISSFAPTKEVFAFHKAHEELYTHMESAARVVLLRAGNAQRPDPEANGWVRALTESHVPFDELVVNELTGPEKLAGKTHLILGDIRGIGSRQAQIVDAFAEQGGTVIATGAAGIRGRSAALACLGVASVKETRRGLMSSMLLVDEEERDTFPTCKEAPYIAIGPELVVTEPAENTKGYLRLVEEHSFGPPELCYFTGVSEIPGILVHSHGKGKGIYVPFKLATLYFQEGYQNSLNLIQDMLFSLGSIPRIAPDLTPMVEIVLRRWEGKTLVQLVNHSGIFANSYVKPLPVRDIELYLDSGITQAQALNGGKVRLENNTIHLDELREYEAIILS